MPSWTNATDAPTTRGVLRPAETAITVEALRGFAGVDIAANDELKTVLWPMPTDNDPDSWALRKEVWEDDRAMIGGSDAGAHLDRMCGATFPT